MNKKRKQQGIGQVGITVLLSKPQKKRRLIFTKSLVYATPGINLFNPHSTTGL